MMSLWRQTVKMPAFPALEGEVRTDVLIIGGGLTGLLCARRLTEMGVDCVVVEAETVAGGTTADTTAKITAQHGLIYHKLLRRFGQERARLYYEAQQAALEHYRELGRTVACDFEEADNYIYTTNHPHRLERELEALAKIGAQADYVRDLPLPLATAGAVRFPRQARFHPLKFAAGLVPGLQIYEHSPVRSFDGRGFHTPRGRILPQKTIVASHFPFLNKHGAYFLKLYQHRSYVLALEGAPLPEGMYLDEAGDGWSFRPQGELLLLGGGGHRSGKMGEGWKGLERLARDRYPGARERFRWAAQDCMSLDGLPYIGPYGRSTPDLFVATGFNKWGMTSAMVSALLLGELVRGKEHPWAELFDPARSMLRPQLAGNAAEALLSLLMPSRPRCPHMGCALKWNPRERSWDCPCHGSRFGEDGGLIQGPATGDMKK